MSKTKTKPRKRRLLIGTDYNAWAFRHNDPGKLNDGLFKPETLREPPGWGVQRGAWVRVKFVVVEDE